MRSGFERLRRGDLDVSALVSAAAEYMDASVLHTAEFAARHPTVALSRDEVRPVLTAVTFLAMMLVGEDLPAPKVADELVAAQIAIPADKAAILTVATEIDGKRDVFVHAQDRVWLAQAVLPSFQDLQFAFDVRLRMKGDSISVALPIAIGFLQTDVATAHVWFQATKTELEKLARQVNRAIRALDTAQRWAGNNR